MCGDYHCRAFCFIYFLIGCDHLSVPVRAGVAISMDVEQNLATRQALKGAKMCKREVLAVALTSTVK